MPRKQTKGYPYREKKKPRTRQPVDRRPHLGHWRWLHRDPPYNEWVENKPTETVEERRFHRPDIRRHDRTEWTLQEAHTLIDMWAEVCWGLGSNFHKEMSRRARYFRRLWNKQKGRCAVTGLELHGAPGCGGHGIGVDIINHKFGIRKGNIRLVSAPIAYTRHKSRSVRHGVIESVNPVMYEDWPVFWAVLKHFQWYLQANDPFCELPVVVKFPIPTLQNQDGDPAPWIRFEWQCYEPSDNTVKGWQNMKVDKTEFAKVYFREDVICINYLHETVDHLRWRDPVGLSLMQLYQQKYDHVIQLCDPTVDFNQAILKWAKKGFVGLGRWLGKIGENW